MANAASTTHEIQLHEPAVDFIDNRLPQYHNAFASSNCRFDPNPRQYTDNSKTNSTTHARPTVEQVENNDQLPQTQFIAAMKLLQATPVKLKAKNKFSIRGKSSWHEVIQVVSEAQKEYDRRPGVLRPIKKAWRVAGEKGEMVVPFLDLIPNGDYTSILSGGLKLIFNAAIRASKLQQDLVRALDDLPRRLDTVKDYINIYRSDEKIHEATLKLYLNILVALEAVIGHYSETTVKHLKQISTEYGKELKEKLEFIKLSVDILISEAVICSQRTIQAIDKKSDLQIQQDIELDSRIAHAGHQLNELHNLMLDLLRSSDANSRWKKNIEERLKRMMKMQEAYYTPPRSANAIITQAQLSFSLHVSSKTAAEYTADCIERCIHMGHTFKSSEQDRAAWLMQSPRMKEWLTSPASEAILVHGNSDPEKISPVSLFCSMLVRNLESLSPARIIHFFCGLNSEPHPPSAAVKMVKSLIFQLLSHNTFDLTFLTRNDLWHIDNNDLRALCSLFGSLILQLNSDTVLFCIIDGINFYETSNRLYDMSIIVGLISELARHTDLRSIFKLLITSPSTTQHVKTGFWPADIISIPETVPQTEYDIEEKQVAAYTVNSLGLWEMYLAAEREDNSESEDNGWDEIVSDE